MNNLKQLTNDIHRKAEKKPWAKLLVSGDMEPIQYGTYLWNQLGIYSALENRALEKNIFDIETAKGLRRMHYIQDDLNYYPCVQKKFTTTLEYEKYVATIQEEQIWAHVYVRHFGDMFGGQMIKAKLPKAKPWMEKMPPSPWPEPGVMLYHFENRAKLITTVRSKLTDAMLEECEYVFQSAINLFTDLENHFDVR